MDGAAKEAAERTLDALDKLETQLLEAKILGAGEAARAWQLNAALSLQAVIEFIASNPAWRSAELDLGLTRLHVAIVNIHKGVTVPWLSPQRMGDRGLSGDRAAMRGCCAGIVTLLMRGGRSQDEAAKWLYELMDDKVLTWLVGSERSPLKRSWRTIARWREAMTGHSEEALGPQQYRRVMEAINALPPDISPSEIEKFAIKMLAGTEKVSRDLGALLPT